MYILCTTQRTGERFVRICGINDAQLNYKCIKHFDGEKQNKKRAPGECSELRNREK